MTIGVKKLLLFLALIFIVVPFVAATSPLGSVVNGQNAATILNSTSSRLVDIVMLGDSNQLFGGYGWDHGWQQAMLNVFGNDTMYGSGLFAFYENNGLGNDVGYGGNGEIASNRYYSGGQPTNATVVPLPSHSAYWYVNGTGGLANGSNTVVQLAGFQGDGNVVSAGIGVFNNSPLGLGENVSDLLAFRVAYGFFNSSYVNASSNFQFNGIQFLTTYSTNVVYTNQANASTVLYNGSDGNGVGLAQFILSNTTKNHTDTSNFYHLRRQSPASTSSASYPFVFYWENFVRINKTAGFQASTLYGVGGASTRNVENFTVPQNSTRIGNYLDYLARYQTQKGYDPMMLVIINFGTNDKTHGVSDAEYQQRMLNITQTVRNGWIGRGYNASNIQFLLITTPPVGDTDTLAGYRQANNNLANNYSYITAIDIAKVTNFTELNTSDVWPHYAVVTGSPDMNHLNSTNKDSRNSYAILATRMIQEVLAYSTGNASVNYCTSLTEAGFTYVLNQTINRIVESGNCIDIQASNITFDCQGKAIYNTTALSATAVSISAGAQNATVKNCNITLATTGTNTGVNIAENNSILLNNTFRNMEYCVLVSSNHNSIINNTMNYCEDSDDTVGYGVSLSSGHYNTLRGNAIFNSGNGVQISTASHNIIDNMTIKYSNNSFGGSVGEGAAITFEGASTNNTFNNSRFDNNIWGIRVNTQGASNQTFSNILINGTVNNSIHLIGVQTRNNSFRNVTVLNGGSRTFDFFSATAHQNGTHFIDSFIQNYSFTGLGSRIIWENSSAGKITFISLVNGSGSNLSAYLVIMNGSIIINDTISNGALNKSANLTFYGLPLNYNVPALYRNGAECSSSICYNFTNLSAGTVLINVTQGGNYTIVETSPTVESSDSGSSSSSSGSGGSGVGSWVTTYYYNTKELVTFDQIALSMNSKTRVLILSNNSTHSVGLLNISSTGVLVEVSSTPQRAFILVNESKLFNLDGDEFFDVSVFVKSVSLYSAMLIVSPVHERVPAGSEDLTTEPPWTPSITLTPLFPENQPPYFLMVLFVLFAISLILRFRFKKKSRKR